MWAQCTDIVDEPLRETDARAAIREILELGNLTFSGHARQEMTNDNLGELDVRNVLRGGWVEPAEWENGSWRYRVRTQRMCVVVAFRSEAEIVVVTAWREQR